MTNLKPTTGTIVRTICAFLLAINMVLQQVGIDPIPFDEGSMLAAAEGVVSGSVILWTWWKNNSFTQNALKADAKLLEMKVTSK